MVFIRVLFVRTEVLGSVFARCGSCFFFRVLLVRTASLFSVFARKGAVFFLSRFVGKNSVIGLNVR